MGKHLLYTWEMRRTLLAIYLIISRGGVWLIEQPSSSLLYRHPRFEELLKMQTVVRHLKNKGFVFCFSDTLRDTVHSWISLGFQAKSSGRCSSRAFGCRATAARRQSARFCGLTARRSDYSRPVPSTASQRRTR